MNAYNSFHTLLNSKNTAANHTIAAVLTMYKIFLQIFMCAYFDIWKFSSPYRIRPLQSFDPCTIFYSNKKQDTDHKGFLLLAAAIVYSVKYMLLFGLILDMNNLPSSK